LLVDKLNVVWLGGQLTNQRNITASEKRDLLCKVFKVADNNNVKISLVCSSI
jgi:hypothetical protein